MSKRLNALEIQALGSVASPAGWNRVALRIKANHGGRYPDDWGDVVIKKGGLLDQLVACGAAERASVITANGWDDLLAQLAEPNP